MILFETHLIKTRKWPLYIIAAILIVCIISISFETDVKNYLIAGILFIFSVLAFVLSKTTITIDNDGMSLTRIFNRTTTLSWAQIRSSTMRWEIEGTHSTNIYWTFVSDTNKKIIIQPSYYTRKDLRLIAGTLIDRSPRATIDKRIRKMADGKFPWYLF